MDILYDSVPGGMGEGGDQLRALTSPDTKLYFIFTHMFDMGQRAESTLEPTFVSCALTNEIAHKCARFLQ